MHIMCKHLAVSALILYACLSKPTELEICDLDQSENDPCSKQITRI